MSLYIPNLVEADELHKIAQVLRAVDSGIPFTILAFFPEHQMEGFRAPNTGEMIDAYQRRKSTGLKNIRLGNLGVFAKTEKDMETLIKNVDPCFF